MKNLVKKLSVVLASLVILFGSLALPETAGATNLALNYGSLTIGCASGPQNGFVAPPTQDNFSGCTITVYNHGTSTLAGTYYNATGSVVTNPVNPKVAAGTVTTSGTTVTWVSGNDFVTTGAWIGQTINIGGVGYTITAVGGAETTITVSQTLVTFSSATSYNVRPQASTIFLADGQYDVCVSNATSTPTLQSSCNYGLTVASGPLVTNGVKAALTSTFTDANASGLQLIPGLSFTFPSTFASSVVFHCALSYSEATPAAGAGFGVAVLTTAPTRLDADTVVYSSAAGASANAPITNLTTTTPTAGATVTPGSTVVYPAYIDGVAQLAGGGAATLQIYVQQGTAADVIAVAPGSYCQLF
jgi:hypothetical protein